MMMMNCPQRTIENEVAGAVLLGSMWCGSIFQCVTVIWEVMKMVVVVVVCFDHSVVVVVDGDDYVDSVAEGHDDCDAAGRDLASCGRKGLAQSR